MSQDEKNKKRSQRLRPIDNWILKISEMTGIMPVQQKLKTGPKKGKREEPTHKVVRKTENGKSYIWKCNRYLNIYISCGSEMTKDQFRTHKSNNNCTAPS